MSISILSFNVGIWTRNWRRSDPHFWFTRAKEMKRMIKSASPDVICFQEIWFPHNLFIPICYRKVLGTGWEHPIYVRRGLKVTRADFHIFWSHARVSGIDVFNMHSTWKKNMNEKICRSISRIVEDKTTQSVVCGDMNNDVEVMSALLPGMTSVRVQLGKEKRDTFLNFTRPMSQGEIDHFFIRGVRPVSFVILDDIGKVRISDHYPIWTNVAK